MLISCRGPFLRVAAAADVGGVAVQSLPEIFCHWIAAWTWMPSVLAKMAGAVRAVMTLSFWA
ncbi:MAG: hypothetical protein M3Z75_26025 [Actinomycetota bacterium]|nr:hypothetical protein [Actinomycetota bacterium]